MVVLKYILYFSFLTLCFHCWTRQCFPSPYKYLPSSATSCTRRSAGPRHCGNVIAGFFQKTFVMASVRRTICVALCCPRGTTIQTYFICECNSTKSSIMTSLFFNIAVEVHCCPLGRNFKSPTTLRFVMKYWPSCQHPESLYPLPDRYHIHSSFTLNKLSLM